MAYAHFKWSPTWTAQKACSQLANILGKDTYGKER